DKYDTVEESWWSNDEYENGQPSLNETYSVEPPKWRKPNKGIDYGDDDKWGDEITETWWEPEEKVCEVFMIKAENDDSEEETIKSELNNHPSDSVKRTFTRYEKELEYQDLVWNVLLETYPRYISREVAISQDEVDSEDEEKNTNPEIADKKGEEFWHNHDYDEETVLTQEREIGCHEPENEREVFIAEDEAENKENEPPEPSTQASNEVNIQTWTQNMTPMHFWKMGSEYRGALNFSHLNWSYGKMFHIMLGAYQELARREYLLATGIDLGCMEQLDIEAVNTYRNDQRCDR
ncbi:18928_t:CDS:2, partial [Dentiscutata erythropus]